MVEESHNFPQVALFDRYQLAASQLLHIAVFSDKLV